MRLDPVKFKQTILPRFVKYSSAASTYVTTDAFVLLKAIQTHFKNNVTSFNFNRHQWRNKDSATSKDMDYVMDLEALASSKLLIGRCNSVFFNLAFLYRKRNGEKHDFSFQKQFECIDECVEQRYENEFTLWLNKLNCLNN